MRIPTIWAKHTEKFEVPNWGKIGNKWNIDGKITVDHHFIGGSNSTEQDAYEQALRKRDIIKAKIEGRTRILNEPDYEVDICEEIIVKIDEQNIITRNKYGALVLNSEHTLFVDIDTNFMYSGLLFVGIVEYFRRFFSSIKNYGKGTIGNIESILSRNKYKHLYTRIYETPNGYRLIILGQDFNANSKASQQLMTKLSADYSYARLCKLQNCYRARLTPKPWRIGVKRPKIVFPFRTEEEDLIHQEWVSMYQTVSERFAACRLVKEIGNPKQSRVVEYHDKFCKALSDLPMA